VAELQNEPVLGVPREPGLRVPAEANVGLDGERGFVPISTMVPDKEFGARPTGFGAASGHVHDVTDMVSVLSLSRSDPGAGVFRQEPDHVRQVP